MYLIRTSELELICQNNNKTEVKEPIEHFANYIILTSLFAWYVQAIFSNCKAYHSIAMTAELFTNSQQFYTLDNIYDQN